MCLSGRLVQRKFAQVGSPVDLDAEEVWGRGVLEFLGDGEARDLRASAVLPDEVYLLQFSYGSGVGGEVCTLR